MYSEYKVGRQNAASVVTAIQVLEMITTILWFCAHQVMVMYPLNGTFLCLGNGYSGASVPL